MPPSRAQHFSDDITMHGQWVIQECRGCCYLRLTKRPSRGLYRMLSVPCILIKYETLHLWIKLASGLWLCFDLHSHLCIRQMLLYKANGNAFQFFKNIFISVFVFHGNQPCRLFVSNAVLYQLRYWNTVQMNWDNSKHMTFYTCLVFSSQVHIPVTTIEGCLIRWVGGLKGDTSLSLTDLG